MENTTMEQNMMETVRNGLICAAIGGAAYIGYLAMLGSMIH